MTDDRPITLSVLANFHRDVILPDIERVVGSAIEGAERRLRDEMQTGFDALAQRLDRLETEYHMLVVGLKRVEERLDLVEKRLDGVEQRLGALAKAHEKYALRSDLEDLKARVEALQEQIRTIEERLES